ncbi:helix-turn-helix domain-containing protein [Pseudorhodoferax sp. Leaf274]|uniref:helix-turn-helix domain-containing protein n=1 Tax=Pseudorhodoferax sp. Leaf274 TaxID=1736318 RepID=UPI0007033749|nr:helix-turn-helix transcriptional regulator [Pseudorhodoferax sp. Leaf274]KQP41344.1 hypothetical protein ASF44_30160 [Pseudorhodoferax sp. Leaf274]
MDSIGSRVKWARERRGLTQAALAKAICVLPGAIGELEAGTRDRPRDLPGLASALGVQVDWLATGQGGWEEAAAGSEVAGAAAGPGRGAVPTSRAATVGVTLVDLGAALSTLSPLARASIAPLLVQIAENPDVGARAAQIADAIALADGRAGEAAA